MEKSMEIIELLYDPAIPFLDIYQRNVSQDTKETLVYNVYLSNVHNSQAMETTQVPYNCQMN
jgi:hypothetical protein